MGPHGAARFDAVIKDGRRTVRPVPAKARPACGPVQASARVRLAPHLSREVFEAHLRTIPAVRSASHVIGDVDYELRLDCRGLADLGVVLVSLRGCQGTEVTYTALVAGEVEGLGRRARAVAAWPAVPRPRQARSA